MQAPDFWDRKTDGVLPTLLRPLGCFVSLVSSMRRQATAPWRAPVPVICVGNLVVGGAGKTPVALNIVQRLSTQGLTPHVVSRGYGGTEQGPVKVDLQEHTSYHVGDEPLLLSRAAPTWVSKDRRAGIEAAVAEGADIIVLDDGFQNPSVEKDLSLIVVDGNYGFGNGRVMPAGPLRESIPDGLKRADAVVLIGADEADVWGRVRRSGFKNLSVIRAKIQPTGDYAHLNGQKVFAFAGIARPEKFYATLRDLGCTLVGCKSFDDHHPFTEGEILDILTEAMDTPVLTTAKDHVRLNPKYRDRIGVVEVELAWKDSAEIDALLAPYTATTGHDTDG